MDILYGANFVILSREGFTVRVLAMSENIKYLKECKTLSGFDNDPNIQIYEVKEAR